MKKIIDGKKYDTETAECIGGWENEYNGLDDRYFCAEELYRKKTGEFFIYSWGQEPYIMPYTLDEAKKWAEEHLTGEKYEEIFGEVEEQFIS